MLHPQFSHVNFLHNINICFIYRIIDHFSGKNEESIYLNIYENL